MMPTANSGYTEGWGATDPLAGWIETTANLIVGLIGILAGFVMVGRVPQQNRLLAARRMAGELLNQHHGSEQ